MFGLSNPRVTRDSSWLMISESLGAVWAVESTRPRDSSSLMISESLGAVWAVECTRHPRQQLVDYF
jgi:hypothetical protein